MPHCYCLQNVAASPDSLFFVGAFRATLDPFHSTSYNISSVRLSCIDQTNKTSFYKHKRIKHLAFNSVTYHTRNVSRRVQNSTTMLTNGQSSEINSEDACKAAYMCVKSNATENVQSVQELLTVLQLAGYNPNEELISKHWPLKAQCMTYEQVCQVLQQEKRPSRQHIMDAFRVLDPHSCGTIERHKLISSLTCKGSHMDEESLLKIIGPAKYWKDSGKQFDYGTFCDTLFHTTSQMTNLAIQMAKMQDEMLPVNTYQTYTKVKKKPESPEKQSWTSCSLMRGAFYFEGESLISHQYSVQVNGKSSVEISVGNVDGSVAADCQLFIFRVNDAAVSKNSESRYLLVDRTPLVIPPSQQCSWTGTLDKGNYLLVPSTTGCRLRKRSQQPSSDIHLIDVDRSATTTKKVKLSPKFEQVLKDIYQQVDLDKNGTLSRVEFNLFNWRTSGEEVQDDEWKVVEENFELHNGELSLDGFLQLHQMEAEDNGGDSAELWVTLNAMGYNHALVQDECATFEVSIRAKEDAPVLRISGLKSGGHILDKATIRCIMEGAGTPTCVAGSKDILVFREDAPLYSSVVLQNRSSSTVVLSMNFGESENAQINHPHFVFCTSLSARSTLFVAHLIPKELDKPFVPKLSVALMPQPD